MALQVSHAAADPAPSEAHPAESVKVPKSWGNPRPSSATARKQAQNWHRGAYQGSLWKEITKTMCKHIDNEQAV